MATQTQVIPFVPKKLKISGDNKNQELINDEDEDKANQLI